jgi:methionyl-tRNA formyltransferase
MKLIFAGTPEFAASALRALVAAGHEIALVLSQPDRPTGRGLALHASPVKALAQTCGIEVFQPATLRDAAAQERLRAVGADAMIVAAYGLILPQAVLDLPRYGCINIHASLLPRWRGAAPIQRALLAGDTETGVCVMQMDTGLDTGAVASSASIAIDARETAASLHDKLAELGARLIVDALAHWPLSPRAQATTGVTYADKIAKSEAPLDWRLPARQLDRQIRAFDPFPGASARIEGAAIKVWRAEVIDGNGAAPGRVVAVDKTAIVVACAEGALRLTELQKAGGRRLPAAQFLAGHAIAQGSFFETPA